MTGHNKQQDEIDNKVTELSQSERLLRAFGPLTGGILLDLLDLATFGSWGFYLGPLFGGLMGWWLAITLGFKLFGQGVLILIAAIYCALPATEFIPFATVVLAVARYFVIPKK